MSTDKISVLRENLEALSIQELRQKASRNFGLKLTRETTKADIINMILELSSKADWAQQSDGDLKPGYSRIQVHPVNGRTPFPFYVNCNGYECFIPFNIPVDVPSKIVKTLRQAQEVNYKFNFDSNETIEDLQLSYPFTLIEERPGPDPRPGIEAVREKKLKPKREFEKKHGWWPTDKALREWRTGATQDELADNEY